MFDKYGPIIVLGLPLQHLAKTNLNSILPSLVDVHQWNKRIAEQLYIDCPPIKERNPRQIQFIRP